MLFLTPPEDFNFYYKDSILFILISLLSNTTMAQIIAPSKNVEWMNGFTDLF